MFVFGSIDVFAQFIGGLPEGSFEGFGFTIGILSFRHSFSGCINYHIRARWL